MAAGAAVTAAALALSQPAAAKAPRGTHVCMAATTYDLGEIRVSQLVTRSGQPVGGEGVLYSPAMSAEVAAPFIALLREELPARMADPAKFCTPVEQSEEQKYLRFVCDDEIWKTDTELYSISGDGRLMSYSRKLAGGMEFQLFWGIPGTFDGPIGALWRTDHYDFLKLGITKGGTERLPLYFTMASPWGSGSYTRRIGNGPWESKYDEAGQARVGNHVFRDWSTRSTLLVLYPDVQEKLLQSPGDFEITAYRVSTGVAAQDTLPRDILGILDSQFKQGYARLLERQRAPQQRCKRVEEQDSPPIIIVD